MKPTLYLDTSVPSYYVAEPSDSLIVAAHQRITRMWWDSRLKRYQIRISQFVLDEARCGNPVLARKRLAVLKPFKLLDLSDEALVFCRVLRDSQIFPRSNALDPSHVGVAAAHGMHFFATWNFKHIANYKITERIRAICREHEFACPVICTPEELMS